LKNASDMARRLFDYGVGRRVMSMVDPVLPGRLINAHVRTLQRRMVRVTAGAAKRPFLSKPRDRTNGVRLGSVSV
jgi:hypothetical protein